MEFFGDTTHLHKQSNANGQVRSRVRVRCGGMRLGTRLTRVSARMARRTAGACLNVPCRGANQKFPRKFSSQRMDNSTVAICVK